MKSSLRVLLGEDCFPCDAPKPLTKSKGEPLAKTFEQFMVQGNVHRPVGTVILSPTLPASAYRVGHDMQGVLFERVQPQTDELLEFADSRLKKIVEEVDYFWQRKAEFDRLGLLHTRGLLLWGQPGTGKSCALQQVVEMMVKRNDLVLFCKSPSDILDGMTALRQVEPDRKAVVCFEELDELAQYNESALLRLMDGDDKIDKVLYVATTNYIHKCSPRLLRPGRFDRKVQIMMPTESMRQQYLAHKLKGHSVSPTQLAEMVRQTEGFSFGHLRELIAGHFAMGEPLAEVIKRLKEPLKETKKETGLLGQLLG